MSSLRLTTLVVVKSIQHFTTLDISLVVEVQTMTIESKYSQVNLDRYHFEPMGFLLRQRYDISSITPSEMMRSSTSPPLQYSSTKYLVTCSERSNERLKVVTVVHPTFHQTASNLSCNFHVDFSIFFNDSTSP